MWTKQIMCHHAESHHAESHLSILCGYYQRRLLLLEKAQGGWSTAVPHNAASVYVLWVLNVVVCTYVKVCVAVAYWWREGYLALPSDTFTSSISPINTLPFTSIAPRQGLLHNSTSVPGTAEVCDRPFHPWNMKSPPAADNWCCHL